MHRNIRQLQFCMQKGTQALKSFGSKNLNRRFSIWGQNTSIESLKPSSVERKADITSQWRVEMRGGGLRDYVCADVIIKWPSPIWSLTETRGVIGGVGAGGCACVSEELRVSRGRCQGRHWLWTWVRERILRERGK